MSSQTSFYIPSVYANITPEMMKKTFNRMNIGEVSHVEFVEQTRRDGKRVHKKAYVYFDRLYDQAGAKPLLDDLLRDGMARVYYANTPHVYWVLLENTRKPTPTADSAVTEEDDELNRSSQYIVYTEEEAAFVPEEDFSMVHSDYASILEGELAKLRYENAQIHYENNQLRMNAEVTFAHYNHAIASNNQLLDQHHKWRELIGNNQFGRLRSIVLRGENMAVCPGANYDGCGAKLPVGEDLCCDCISALEDGEVCEH
jgi:hypothetical protein